MSRTKYVTGSFTLIKSMYTIMVLIILLLNFNMRVITNRTNVYTLSTHVCITNWPFVMFQCLDLAALL